MVKKPKWNAEEAWANASAKVKKEGTTLNALIARRDKGDQEAQNKINDAYGVGQRGLSKESRAHLDKQLANAGQPAAPKRGKKTKSAPDVIGDYQKVKKAREDKEYAAMNNRLNTVSRAAGEMAGEGAFRNQVAEEYAKNNTKKKKMRRMIAGQ